MKVWKTVGSLQRLLAVCRIFGTKFYSLVNFSYFEQVNHFCFNGEIISNPSEAKLQVDPSSVEGIFETMKLERGCIVLGSFHFDRLFKGLSLLDIGVPAFFTREKITKEIGQVARHNTSLDLARIRLTVWIGKSELRKKEEELSYLIESEPLDHSVNKLNEEGLVIGIVPGIEKNTNKYSNLKLISRDEYNRANEYARAQGWDEGILLNDSRQLADGTITNLFIIKNGGIKTTALDQGCVEGVMRRYLIEQIGGWYEMSEGTLSEKDIEEADEVFLTNAIRGIRWVRQFGNKKYSNEISAVLFEKYLQTISAEYYFTCE